MISTHARNYAQYILLALRIGIGVFFILHGLSKFGVFGEGGFGEAIGFFRQLDLPAPNITAPILAVVETLGGLALTFGVLARTVAILLAVVVIAEIMLGKLPQTLNPFGEGGYIFELLLLGGLLVLAFLGPGPYALDEGE